MNIAKGSVVKAIAGRDKNKIFLITDIIDEQFSHIADGRSRPVERPKRKKNKHIVLVSASDSDISELLQKGEKITNSRLRKALIKYNS